MMSDTGQYVAFLLAVTLLAKPCGVYMARVFADDRAGFPTTAQRLETIVFRACGIRAEQQMSWAEYARAFVWFGAFGTLLLYVVLRLQTFLPLQPNAGSLTTPLLPDLAINTAVSFATTTTWQAYAGESTMTYATQLVGLAAQNFLAGAAGLAIGIAFIRALAHDESSTIGNFWVDLVRSVLWILLPLSLIGSVVLVWLGVPMTFSPYITVAALDGGTQTIATGPVAALEFIKQLGTNGGGFFNANGAHPLENPSASSNFIELLAIAVLPAALTCTFGRMTNRQRDGWILYGVMVAVFAGSVALGHWAEMSGTPALASATHGAPFNMEGKETRFGVSGSVLAAAVTAGGATGSYNSMHDSFTPLGGAMPLVSMLLGEISFGGLGTGIVSVLLLALLGLFITGLMIGRTPEYLGKSIGATEMKFVLIYMLAAPVAILAPTAIAVLTEAGRAGLTTNGAAHGFTEILFAFASSFGNNGQNFAGLSANTPFYNVATAIVMMLGRFALVIAALALAGQLAMTKRRVHDGAVPTDSILFGTLVLATAIVTGALTFLPALAVGPLAEYFTMLRG